MANLRLSSQERLEGAGEISHRMNAYEEPDFLFVGRLVSEKEVEVLIRAFYDLSCRRPGLSSVIVGDGPLREKLELLAQSLGLSQAIQFLGAMTGNKIIQVMSKATVRVVPSVWAEPYGGIAVELLAAGLPVVTTEVSDPADKIREAGAVVPNGDVRELAHAMESVFDLAKSDPKAILAAIDRSLEPLSEDWILHQYEQLLENLCGCQNSHQESRV